MLNECVCLIRLQSLLISCIVVLACSIRGQWMQFAGHSHIAPSQLSSAIHLRMKLGLFLTHKHIQHCLFRAHRVAQRPKSASWLMIIVIIMSQPDLVCCCCKRQVGCIQLGSGCSVMIFRNWQIELNSNDCNEQPSETAKSIQCTSNCGSR